MEDLSKMSREELVKFRRELAGRRATIDRKLDNQAFGDMDEEEIRELEEKDEEYVRMIENIDKILNTRSR